MKALKAKASKVISAISNMVEGLIAIVLIIAVFYLVVQMATEYGGYVLQGEKFDFTSFLVQAMNLIIGIEFTKMLFKNTPDTIIDVLMFATARQAILDHSRILENLLAVVAIAILFVLRNYVGANQGKRNGSKFFRFKWRASEQRAPVDSSVAKEAVKEEEAGVAL